MNYRSKYGQRMDKDYEISPFSGNELKKKKIVRWIAVKIVF